MRQIDINRLPDGVHSAGRNLFLIVKGDSRSWMLRMKLEGRQIKRGLGSASTVSLSEARAKVERLRADIRSGREERKESRRDKALFRDIYMEVIEAKERVKKWRNEKHSHQWRQTIEDYALPILGGMEVAKITRKDVLRVLVPIWEVKAETATRLRARLEAIFGWAIRNGMRTSENPARWKENLEYDLPSRSKVQTVEHHEAPTLEELQALVPRLLKSVSGRAILFGVLTASRVSEFVPARWSEIDLKSAVWSVPPERRKDSRPYPHRVPLSRQAVEILESMDRTTDYLFPGLSDNHIHKETPRRMLIKMLHRPVTMHGCRSTFRDWCAETGQDGVLAEKSLMHSVGGEVYQAYQRSDLLEQRRPLMQAWSDAVTSKCNKLLVL